MNNIRVSVAMATYNGEKYIKEQIDSILNNLSDNDEIVISDDGSKDNTLKIIEEYNDSRIKIFNGPKLGVKKNFENAIFHSNGQYIFLADQDDIWIDGKVDKVLSCFEKNKNLKLVIHDAIVFDSETRKTIYSSYMDYRKSKKGIVKNIIKNSYIGCCMAIKRDLVECILPIPTIIEMHDQWIGIIAEKKGDVCFLKECLIKYRRHSNNVSSFSHYSIKKMLYNRKNFIKEYFRWKKKESDKAKLFLNGKIIYVDENYKSIYIIAKNSVNIDFLFKNNAYYRTFNYNIPQKLKKIFLKESNIDKIRKYYFYFINYRFNKNPFFHFNELLKNECNIDISDDKAINKISEEFDTYLQSHNYKYVKRKSKSEIYNALKYKIIIVLKHYLYDEKNLQKELKNLTKKLKIENYKKINNLNILTGSQNVILYKYDKPKFFLKGYDIFNLYKNELKILKQLDKYDFFPHIIVESKNYFVEEFIDGQNLEIYLKENKITHKFINEFYKFSNECLKILNENRIVHRDIRPENIIVNKINESYKFYLIDFGCAVINNIDPLKKKNEYIYKIAKTIGNEYKYDNYHWDDAISFYIIQNKLGKSQQELKNIFGKNNVVRWSLW